MSGSANAGTNAERHRCALKILPAESARSLKRVKGELHFPVDKDSHGCR